MRGSLALAAAVVLGLAVPVLAQEGPPAERRVSQVPVLSVTGEGQISVEPDVAVVRLGAGAQEKEAAAAQARVNEAMQKILAAIKQAGVPAEQLQTSGLNLSPVYAQRPPRADGTMDEPRIVAYHAEITVTARLKDLKRAGPVIDAGLAAGANRLHGISFELQDETRAKAAALRMAVNAAQAKARAMAEALGVELSQLMEATEGGAQIIRPMYEGARDVLMGRAESMASTPVEAGQVQVSASVTLRYRIGGAGVPAAGREGAREMPREVR
jgi:uncharacterized protein YggE